MNADRIDAVLDLLSAEELGSVLHWIDVFERWSLSAPEADQWRRQIRKKTRLPSGSDKFKH